MPFAEQKRRILQQKIDQEFKEIADNMPISTIDTVPGYEVLEYKGKVSSAGLFSLEELVKLQWEGACNQVLNEAVSKAKSLGGNAIVGLKVTNTPFPIASLANDLNRLLVTCIGTAVSIRKKVK